MLCATIPEEINRQQLIPDKKLPESSLVNQFSWGIQKYKEEVAYRRRNITKTGASSKLTPTKVTACESWKLEAHCMICCPVGWKVSFPGSSEPLLKSLTALCFFYAVHQVSAFSRQLSLTVACSQFCWPEHLLAQFVLKSLSSLYC